MNVVERVMHILRTPRTEWEAIDAEPTTAAALYTGHIVPLTAIGPIARVIGYSVSYVHFCGGVYRTPIGAAITGTIVLYALSLAGVYVLALIIDALAPTFGGTKNQMLALKVEASSSTASCAAGIFTILPVL